VTALSAFAREQDRRDAVRPAGRIYKWKIRNDVVHHLDSDVDMVGRRMPGDFRHVQAVLLGIEQAALLVEAGLSTRRPADRR
jgi:hypothetical protein